MKQDYEDFLLHQASQFEKVFVLAGNHEYYIGGFNSPQHSVGAIKQRIRAICNKHPNLMFMDRDSIVIDGVRVVGCTLWSEIPREHRKTTQGSINDYHLCYVDVDAPGGRDEGAAGGRLCGSNESKASAMRPGSLAMSPSPDVEGSLEMGQLCFIADEEEAPKKNLRLLKARDTTRWHKEDVAFITREAKQAKSLGQRLLVLTHHAPTFKDTSNPRYLVSPLRLAFATELDYMFDWKGKSDFSAIHTWVSGHTHWSTDQIIGGVHIVSNQYGYSNTSESIYKPNFVVTV